MKSSLPPFILNIVGLTAMLILSACGKGNSDQATTKDISAPTSTITITGNDLMRFEPRAFTVRAGTTVTLVFKNIGRMPKATMGHNLAIIDKSVSPHAFSDQAMGYPNTAYIAPKYADKVIAATDVLGPGESETLVFTAPNEPGEYPFVCSFPSHTPAGMWGIMTVVE